MSGSDHDPLAALQPYRPALLVAAVFGAIGCLAGLAGGVTSALFGGAFISIVAGMLWRISGTTAQES